MRLLLAVLLPIVSYGQVLFNELPSTEALPEKLLSTRSAVVYSYTLSEKELNEVHSTMVRAGVDAVAYFELDRVFAGADVELAFRQYFMKREISTFIIVEKKNAAYQITVTPYKGKESLIEADQAAWRAESSSLNETLRLFYNTAFNTLKKQNMLINDIPETELVIPVITGRRSELFASDLKADRLAVLKFGDNVLDQELEEIMKAYPFKYALVDNTIPEPELRKQGYFYILRYVHTRGSVAKKLLDYEVSKAVTANASITYSGGQEQVKTIPSDQAIFKFYTRQIEFNNVFLGTKWDADVTWQAALINFIAGFRKEMRVN
jgi:hypothetical protein